MGGGFHRSSERATEEYECGVGSGRSLKEMKEEGFSTKKGALIGKKARQKVVGEVVCCFLVAGEDERRSPKKMTCYRTNKFHDTLNGRF